MKRIVCAAAALLALSVPALAQYGGGYYGDRGYGGGYYGDRYERRRGYDPYEDDDRPRRDRRPPPGYQANPYGGGPPAHSRRGGAGNTCVTPGRTCRVAPSAIGTPCGCSSGGFTSRGSVQ